MPLRLTWRQTWLDNLNDGCVDKRHLDDPTDVLRVMRRAGGPHDGEWWWTASRLLTPGDDGMRRPRNGCGYAQSKEAAQLAAEREYLR